MNYGAVIFGFFGWWYSGGVKKLAKLQRALFSYISNLFSISALLKTFFSPWRRITTERRAGLSGFWDAIIDNTISRLVGIMARIVLLSVYLFLLLFYFSWVILSWLIWLFPPILFLGLIILGVA